MAKPSLILVGVPGVGKSTVAKLLSELLGQPVTETDTLVAERSRIPEEDALVILGEDVFRDLEAEASLQALHTDGIVVLGSGAVLNPQTRRAISECGVPVYWLQASLAAISPRAGLNRPHPASLGLPRALWKQLEREREALYQEVCTAEIDTSKLDATAVAAQIAADFND